MDGSGESMFRGKNTLLIKNKIFSFTVTESTTQQTTSKWDRMMTELTRIEFILAITTTPPSERISNLSIWMY